MAAPRWTESDLRYPRDGTWRLDGTSAMGPAADWRRAPRPRSHGQLGNQIGYCGLVKRPASKVGDSWMSVPSPSVTVSGVLGLFLLLFLQQTHVLKFGNWVSDSDVPYTQYFDKAHKGKTAGKLINPNDPQENPESFAQDVPVRASPSRVVSGPEAPRSRNGDVHWPTGSPLRKPPSDSPQHRYGDRRYPSDPNRRARRASGGSDRSLEQSLPSIPMPELETELE